MTNARTAKSAREKAAELRAQAERAETRRRNLMISAVIAVVLVVAVVVVVVVRAASDDQKAKQTAAAAPPANLVGGGFLVGNPSAKATIELYEDFQCPVCKAFEADNGAQIKSWVAAGTAKVIYHPVAILDADTKYSTRSGSAAAAVYNADPKAFQAFHDLLYTNQPAEGGSGLPDSQLVDYAVQAGVAKATIEPLVTAQKFAGWVSTQTDDFSKKGFTGTPTVVVNGTQLGNGKVPTAAAFTAAVEAAAK